jgi:hypothetical protein
VFPARQTKFLRADGSIGKEPGNGIVLLGAGDVANDALRRSGLGACVTVVACQTNEAFPARAPAEAKLGIIEQHQSETRRQIMGNLSQQYDGGFDDGFSGRFTPRGITTKWIAQKGWHDRDGLPVPLLMLLLSIDTLLISWHPVHDEIRAKPLPDVGLLNSAIPTSELRMGLDGKLEPKWKFNYEFRLVDLQTGKLYVFINSTWGAQLCYDSIREAVCVARMLRGAKVLPMVRLEARPMPTTHNRDGLRPHLEPTGDWRELASSGDPASLASPAPAPAQLPAPTADTSQAAAATTPVQIAPPAPTALNALKPAAPPIPVEQFVGDEVPY